MGGKEEKNASITQIIMDLIERKKPQNVQQLINLMKDRTPIPQSEIIEHVLRLQNQGKISLKEPPIQISHALRTYLKTKEAYWYWAMLILTASTAISVFTIPESVYPIVFIRYILGTVSVIYLPGYSFMKALFPEEPPIKTSSQSLDSIERIALSLGMSIALVPIIGLILNYTPWGIRLTPVILSLLTLTVTCATVGILREYGFQVKQPLKS